jgi:hypothetical protein
MLYQLSYAREPQFSYGFLDHWEAITGGQAWQVLERLVRGGPRWTARGNPSRIGGPNAAPSASTCLG